MNLSAARRLCCAAALIVVIATPTVANDDPWPGLALDVFNGRALEDGSKVLVLDMPSRAEDAAIVPVTMRVTLPAADLRRLKGLTLVIDQNPAPVAATFSLGERSGVTSITTRVRIDAYTNVHAVAELSDGKLYVVQTYVKASGGCSAPADKNPEEAKKNAGQMRLVQFSKPADGPFSSRREAQIMIRHPNNSGLQMDQVTRHYVPAFFVREMRVWQGDELVMSMESGISLSEDPNIRFDYIPNGAKGLRVEAIDTDDRKFKGEWPINSSAM